MAEWISVKERLPKQFAPVLVCMPGEYPHPLVREGFINRSGEWRSNHFTREPGEVTHWMPMPLPPNEVLEYLLKKGAPANDS